MATLSTALASEKERLIQQGFRDGGFATPDYDPGLPSSKVFYLATELGTYEKFGNIEVESGDTVLLIYDTSLEGIYDPVWGKISVGEPKENGGGSSVELLTYYTEGTRIATMTIDGNQKDIFVPKSSGGGLIGEEFFEAVPAIQGVSLKSQYGYIDVNRGFYFDGYSQGAAADFEVQVVNIDVNGVPTPTRVLHSRLPIYSDSFVSAGGLSPTGGSAGITDLGVWKLLTNDPYLNSYDNYTKIASAHIPDIYQPKYSFTIMGNSGATYDLSIILANSALGASAYSILENGLYVAGTRVKTSVSQDTLLGVNAISYNLSSDENDNARIEWVSNAGGLGVGAWHIKGNLYADGWISAGGISNTPGQPAGNASYSRLDGNGGTITNGTDFVDVYSREYITNALATAGRVKTVALVNPNSAGDIPLLSLAEAFIGAGYKLTDTTYSPGTGLTLTGTVFSVTPNTYHPYQGSDSLRMVASQFTFNKKLSDNTTESTLTWDDINKAWKITGNLYATGWISAGGVSTGSGSAGIDPVAMWEYLTNTSTDTTYDETQIHPNHIPVATTNTVGGIELGYNENDRNYAVRISNGKAYVTVPWIEAESLIPITDAIGDIKSSIFGINGSIVDLSMDIDTLNSGLIYLDEDLRNELGSLSDDLVALDARMVEEDDFLQAQIDSVSSRNMFDELYATTFFADILAASDIYGYLHGTSEFAEKLTTAGPLAIWGVTYWNNGIPVAVTDRPNLYIGTTRVQISNVAQALTGITTITASGQAEVGSLKLASGTPTLTWDPDHSAWHLSGNFYADGFVSSGGLSDGSGQDAGNASYTKIDDNGGTITNGTDTVDVYSRSYIDAQLLIAGQVKKVAGISPDNYGDIPVFSLSTALNLKDAASYDVASSVTQNDTTHLVTGAAVWAAIDALPEPMVFKGSLGTGGTIQTLPTPSPANDGFTYKVITAGTYAGKTAKVGDTFISTGSEWVLIPSGDEPEGTVTSVGISLPTGLKLASGSTNPITTSGTFNIVFNTGYSIPLTADVTKGVDAYGYFTNGVANSAAKLTTVSKTAWGQTYWTSGGVPDSISGDMSNVGTITPASNNAKDLGTSSVFWRNTYTKKIYFDSTFYIELVNVAASGETPHYVLHTNTGLYSDSFISAGGYSDHGGSSGIDEAAMWAALQRNSGEGLNKKFHYAHLPACGTGLAYTLDGNDLATTIKIASGYYLPTDEDRIAWNAKQDAISDLATIRSRANEGHDAYGWGDHSQAGYFMASDFNANNIVSTLGTTAVNRATADANGNNIINTYATKVALTTVEDNLQAQIDSVSSRNMFDELYATTMFSDMGAFSTLYAASIDLNGNDLATTLDTFLTSVPEANNNTYGGFKTGYAESREHYAVQLSSGKAFVYVPDSIPYADAIGDIKSAIKGLGESLVDLSMDIDSINALLANPTLEAIEFKLVGGAPVMTWDETNQAWHLNGNFYADGFVSAGGFSNGGGSGSTDLPAVWTSLANQTVTNPTSTTKIHPDHIPDMASTYGYKKAISLAAGTSNGTLRLTVDGSTSSDVAVTGLADAAYRGIASSIGSSITGLVSGSLLYGILGDSFDSTNTVKAFVNSSIATATATFRGTNTTATTESAFITWANGLTHDLNDYVFWQTTDSAGNTLYKRYKYDGTNWSFEYTLNNSSFTSAQWNAINSGITSTKVNNYDTIVGYFSGGLLSASHVGDLSGTYLALSGGTMTGTLSFADNVGITASMGGGTDGWGIVGTGSEDNGRLKIYVTDNGTSDWMDFEFRDYGGTTYTPLSMTGNQVLFSVNPSVSGNAILHAGNYSSYALPLAGGTMTGALTLKANQYSGLSGYGMNANNSDIVNLNAIYTADLADDASEGINFYRSSGRWDSLTSSYGVLYYYPNRADGTTAFSGAYTIYHSGNFNPADYLPLSGGTMSNTNLVTNLNADLLDGKNADAFGYTIGSANWDCNEVGTHFASYRFGGSPLNGFTGAEWSNMLVVGSGSDTMTQIGGPYSAQELYFRNGTWYSDSGSIRSASWNRLWHSGNSNKSDVAWACSNLEASGVIHSTTGIYSDGYVSAGGLSSSSDERLKTAIKDFKYSKDLLMSIRPREWDWNGKAAMKGHAAGFVAQEIEPLIPYAVDNAMDYKALFYDQFHAIEIAGLQDHERRIRELENAVKARDKKIDELEKRLKLRN